MSVIQVVVPDVLEFLDFEKGQRVCDIKVYLPAYSADQILEMLNAAVQEGSVDQPHGRGEQALYFKKRSR